jgi:ubiquinone/menaquinone biosynthesis C-methylase UbiE
MPGERVLDVDCREGAVALEAARRVGPRGLVLGVDTSASTVERARRRAADAGLSNVGFVRADARTRGFGPLRFDAVVSRTTLTRFVESDTGFAMLAYVLGGRGRLVFACPADAALACADAQRSGFLEPVEEVVDGTRWLVAVRATADAER